MHNHFTKKRRKSILAHTDEAKASEDDDDGIQTANPSEFLKRASKVKKIADDDDDSDDSFWGNDSESDSSSSDDDYDDDNIAAKFLKKYVQFFNIAGMNKRIDWKHFNVTKK